MRKIFLIILASQALSFQLIAQVSGSFIVYGDLDKFYPVSFYDGGWDSSAATELSIGRSNVHTDATWRGSVIARFRYHVTNWGHESNFIDADVKQFNIYNTTTPNTFIAGWQDASPGNTYKTIVIWLRGGSTTYFYHSNYTVSPTIYDGSQHALPYSPWSGQSYTYKTAIDSSYVNSKGLSNAFTGWFNGDGVNYFKGNVGIGTTNPQGKLAVNGDIYSKKVKVTQLGWGDYVFHASYRLRPLSDVEQYIQLNHHLPDIPSAEEIEKNGLDLGDNQAAVVVKVEELTLYILQLNKELDELRKEVRKLKNERQGR